MILKAVLINRTEVWTDPSHHYDAMRAWLDSHTDQAVRDDLEKQLDAGTVDLDFGYVNITSEQFVHHQYESSERRGERWAGAFHRQPELHNDPSEFTTVSIGQRGETIIGCKSSSNHGIVKGNNK